MNTSNKISVIITAGGNSSRFGSNKLLEIIKGRSVIETTIEKFIGLVDEIVVVCPCELRKFINFKDIVFALNGSTRQKSVLNGLLACSNPDFVLIHDGARPFVDREIIKKTIEEVKKYNAVVVGSYAIDTIKEVKEGKIIKTIDRKIICQAHTPQAFKYSLIKELHLKYKDKDFTDDSSLAEIEGIEVNIVEDLKTNIKITTKEDVKFC